MKVGAMIRMGRGLIFSKKKKSYIGLYEICLGNKLSL